MAGNRHREPVRGSIVFERKRAHHGEPDLAAAAVPTTILIIRSVGMARIGPHNGVGWMTERRLRDSRLAPGPDAVVCGCVPDRYEVVAGVDLVKVEEVIAVHEEREVVAS